MRQFLAILNILIRTLYMGVIFFSMMNCNVNTTNNVTINEDEQSFQQELAEFDNEDDTNEELDEQDDVLSQPVQVGGAYLVGRIKNTKGKNLSNADVYLRGDTKNRAKSGKNGIFRILISKKAAEFEEGSISVVATHKTDDTSLATISNPIPFDSEKVEKQLDELDSVLLEPEEATFLLEPTGTVRGLLKEKDSEEQAATQTMVMIPGTDFVFSVNNETFEMEGLPKGTWDIVAVKEGYKEQEIKEEIEVIPEKITAIEKTIELKEFIKEEASEVLEIPGQEAPIIRLPYGIEPSQMQSEPIEITLNGDGEKYYTLDGSDPDIESKRYQSPIRIGDVSGKVTLKSISIGLNGKKSNISKYTFEFDLVDLNPISTPLTEGIYSSKTTLKLFQDSEGKAIYYTTDLSTPSKSSTLYENGITLASGENTIKAIAIKSGFDPSPIFTINLSIDDAAPVFQGNLTPSNMNNNSASISWQPCTDNYSPASKLEYKLVVSSNESDVETFESIESATGSKVKADWSKGILNTSLSNLDGNATYFGRVACKDTIGLIGLSPKIQFTTSPNPPENLNITPGTNELHISFDPSTGASGYYLYYGTDVNIDSSSTVIDLGTNTNHTLSNLDNETVYYFRVSAYSSNGESALGNSGNAAPIFQKFEYSSFGDTNGIVYYLGTNQLQEAFSNPMTVRGTLSVSRETAWGGNPEDTVDRSTTGQTQYNSPSGHWMQYDFQKVAYVRVQQYTIRQNANHGTNTAWILQGSHDGINWSDVDTRSGESLSNNQWQVYTVNGTTDFYQYWRLLSNFGNNEYYGFAEIEFYGEINPDGENNLPPTSNFSVAARDNKAIVYINTPISGTERYVAYVDTSTPTKDNSTRIEGGVSGNRIIEIPNLTNGTTYKIKLATINGDGVEGPISVQEYTVTPSTTFDFDSFEGINGVLYHLGTQSDSQIFQNPHTSGYMTAQMSSIWGGSPEKTVNRISGEINYTLNSGERWLSYDFKKPGYVKVDSYAIKQNRSNAPVITGWKLEGSHDAINWVEIDSVTGESPSNEEWKHYTVNGISDFYQYWRIDIGGNMPGTYFGFDEIEFFGEIDASPLTAPPSALTTAQGPGKITVFIDAPVPGIDNYVVYYDTVTPTKSSNSVESTGGSKVIAIDSLTNGTTYQFRVATKKDGIIGPLTSLTYSNTPSSSFDFDFNFDGNGIIYYLGTNSHTQVFDGAQTGIISTWKSTWGGTVQATYDRDPANQINYNYQSGQGWLQYDFGNASIRVSSYSIKSNRSNAPMITGWDLQGSNNGSDWTNIHNQLDTSWSHSEWRNFTPSSTPAYYRYLRVIETQTTTYFGYDEIEFYGDIIEP